MLYDYVYICQRAAAVKGHTYITRQSLQAKERREKKREKEEEEEVEEEIAACHILSLSVC